jgi:hypothetical protein
MVILKLKMVCHRHNVARFFFLISGCYGITTIVYCLNKIFLSSIIINTVYFSVIRMCSSLFFSFCVFTLILLFFFSCYILPLSSCPLIVFFNCSLISPVEKNEKRTRQKKLVLRLTFICIIFILFNGD